MSKRLTLRKRAGLELFRRLQAERIAHHELHTLFWECTLRCNLHCRHCGSDCMSSSVQPDMPASDFFRTLDTQITPHVDTHRVLVILSGGEVLVRPDLDRIGLELYRREYPWGMVTNGLALDEKRFDRLLRAGLHSITVSLDGFREDHNYLRGSEKSYDAALRAVTQVTTSDAIEGSCAVRRTARKAAS